MDPVTQTRALGGSQLSSDRGVSALLSNYKNEIPLVLILGNKCRVAPVTLPPVPSRKKGSIHGSISNSRVISRNDTVLWVGLRFLLHGFVLKI
jgi:hypothetical protein